MAEATRSAWETQRLANATPIVIVSIRTPMGQRYYGQWHPRITSPLGGGFFDSDSYYDGDVYFDADAIILEQGARVIRVEGLDQSAQPIDTEILGSWAQSQRTLATVELDNGDREMSKIVGQEYLLNQEAIIYITFPGLDLLDALQKVSGIIKRWTLTKKSLRLEIEVR